MSEFIISFELYTIIYIIILIPILTFLIVLAYRCAKSVENYFLEKFNRRLVNENKEVVWENMKLSKELMSVQRELLQQQKELKKEYEDND